MSKTVQIRDIDDDTYAALQRHAIYSGLSVPSFLKREVGRIASRPTMEEWLERTGRGALNSITADEVLEALDDIRGPWPNADR